MSMQRASLYGFDARFHARVQRTKAGVKALINVIGGDGLPSDTDLRHFKTDPELRRWLTEEAHRRGFSSIAVEFVR